MANLIYLTLKGKKQGLISNGCSSVESIGNLCQNNHTDEIFVYELSHSITREQNSNHHPVTIKKPIDKSSPLLGVAVSDNEELECLFDFYRTNSSGQKEKYYSVKLTGASITDISPLYPNSLTHNEAQPQESVSFIYKNIVWTHHLAGTSGYSIWEDRVY